jgi:CheY-like chemotaxis protein
MNIQPRNYARRVLVLLSNFQIVVVKNGVNIMFSPQRKILIADHNQKLIDNIAFHLKQLGYSVVATNRGEDVIALCERERPNLIMLDNLLPNVDGLEVCWRLREIAHLAYVPIIILSNKTDVEIRINCLRCGADAFIHKPVYLRELVTLIEMLLKRSEHFNAQSVHVKKSIEGRLDDFPLLEIVQLLNLAQKTGVLSLYNSETSGLMLFERGDIKWAACAGTEGESAFYKMAAWNQGTYEFEKQNVPSVSNIQKATIQLILDTCELLDRSEESFVDKKKSASVG